MYKKYLHTKNVHSPVLMFMFQCTKFFFTVEMRGSPRQVLNGRMYISAPFGPLASILVVGKGFLGIGVDNKAKSNMNGAL